MCARVILTMWKYQTRNQTMRRPINSISSSLLLLSEKAKSKLVTQFCNTMYVSDVMHVIEGAVKAQYIPVWKMTVMLYSPMPPTATLFAQTWCTLLTLWKLLMVGHGNPGEWAGWGTVRNSDYINRNLVESYTCRKFLGESAGMW